MRGVRFKLKNSGSIPFKLMFKGEGESERVGIEGGDGSGE